MKPTIKKNSLTLCVFICITSYSYAQFVRDYSINIFKEYSPKRLVEYSLHFILNENYNYEIYMIDYNHAIRIIYPFSAGSYEINNDTLLFTDSYTHCQLVYQLDSSASLIPIKTFLCMKELVFKDYSIIAQISNDVSDTIFIEKIANDFSISNIQNHHFEEGMYEYDFFHDSKFELYLNSDKNYMLRFKIEEVNFLSSKLKINLLFSSGKWERKGNILLLWDTNLEHQFYGLVRKDGIELLFFQLNDFVFKRQLY